MPTDRDRSRLRAPQNGYPRAPVTGPRSHRTEVLGWRWEWDSTCCPGVHQDGRGGSLAAMIDNPDIRDLADIPAIEVISRAALMLMSSAAEKIGLSAPDPDNSEYRDLDEARRLITALAGLLTASLEFLGPHARPLKDGLRSLQLAFREASAVPDEPGFGPGEKLTGGLH